MLLKECFVCGMSSDYSWSGLDFDKWYGKKVAGSVGENYELIRLL